jgi:hypothetical protein
MLNPSHAPVHGSRSLTIAIWELNALFSNMRPGTPLDCYYCAPNFRKLLKTILRNTWFTSVPKAQDLRPRTMLPGTIPHHAANESSSSGSGMLDGGSLVGNESARVLSSILSRIAFLSSSFTGRSSGSRRRPGSSESWGCTCGLPVFSSLISHLSGGLTLRCRTWQQRRTPSATANVRRSHCGVLK